MHPIIERQLDFLRTKYDSATATPLQGGFYLIEIRNVRLPVGWNRAVSTVLFLVPPGYPAARPDCFWLEPGGVRLGNGATPQNTSDSNPIPGLQQARSTTWFSWHLQQWNPNQDSLLIYMNVIERRLDPPR